MTGPVDCLVVSVLPRGEPFGCSALVALDPESLERLAVRPFPAEEYLRDPETAVLGEVPHCRGIVQVGDRLLAALFNGVREYEVEDIRRLRLEPRAMLSDERAVDLHGLEQANGRLSAASTGSNSIVSWELASGRAIVAPVGPSNGDDEGDLRFPRRLAREASCGDWRQVLRSDLHLNGVSHLEDGSLIVAGLTRVLELDAEGAHAILEDGEARMHDGCPARGGELLLTDAARGALVVVDLDSGSRRFIPVSDPKVWFVRGLAVAGRLAYVLRSEVVPSRQRGAAPVGEPPGLDAFGGRFGVSVVDLGACAPVAERDIELPTMARGTVAYGLLAWDETA